MPVPATAANQPVPDDEPGLASVVSLDARRGVKPTPSATPTPDFTDAELQEHAARHWGSVFKEAGIEVGDPKTAAVVAVVTQALDRLVGGLLVIREGREDLPANPEAGFDLTSAVEMSGVLRDLKAFVESAQAKRD
jgi:hypothetical protein